MPQCCVRSCGAHGVYRVTNEQMTATVAAHQKGARGCVRQEDMCYSCDDSDDMMVCEKHAWNVIKSHVAQQVLAETSKQTMARKDFIHDVLMAVGAHASQQQAGGEEPGARQTERTHHGSSADVETDLLTQTFLEVRPFIHSGSFMYSFMMTMLRCVGHANHLGGFVVHGGEHFCFTNSFEGTDVLRCFTCFEVSLPIGSSKPCEEARWCRISAVRCSISAGSLPGIPSVRQLRRYSGTAFPIEDILTISEEAPIVMTAADIFERSELTTSFIGCTVDCVYGESRTDVVYSLDSLEKKAYFMVGGSTATSMVGAALRASDIQDRDALEGDAVATQLMTVVLHGFDKSMRFWCP